VHGIERETLNHAANFIKMGGVIIINSVLLALKNVMASYHL